MSLRIRVTAKPTYERAAKKSVSMPEILLDKGEARMRQYGLSQFSHYVQFLIRRDINSSERLTP